MTLPSHAQQTTSQSSNSQPSGQIDLRIPPPPPPAEAAPAAPSSSPRAVPADLPQRVILPAGTQVDVTLETPMSTRISKKGQIITFRSVSSIPLEQKLELPPETALNGRVISARKPGGFGRGGELQIQVQEIEVVPGQVAPLQARIESADLISNGRARADSNKGANIMDLAQWAIFGTSIGHGAAGGKGAGYGAAAGALAAIIIMMSRKGSDIYIEPGTPFRITLDQPVELAGLHVWQAQEAWTMAHPARSNQADPNNSGVGAEPGPIYPEGERPKLKHRPPKQNP